MKRGDKIVSVNGIDLSRATHEDAAIALKNAGNTVALRLFYSPEDYERFEAKIHSIKNQVRWWKLYFNKDSNGWAKKWTPGLGPCTNDVSVIFGIFDPPTVRIFSIEITQPPHLSSEIG